MKLKLLCYAILICTFFSDLTLANTEFEKLLPFTGTDQLRIDIEILSESKKNGIDIRADIRSFADKKQLFQGSLGQIDLRIGKNPFQFSIRDLHPRLWSPVTPELYLLTLTCGKENQVLTSQTVRFGFRSFDTKNGKLYLNGKPIFLRGIAINPPGRGIPPEIEQSRVFAEEYVRFMKSISVNIIRIPDNQDWYDVCDEYGMMVFGGNYSLSVGGEKPPPDYDKGVEWYKNVKFGPIAHHPSLMIYALTNEVPYKGPKAEEWIRFLQYAHQALKKWDPSRLYIGNAGYGYGQSGDICDIHRYWGWYYASPFTFLHIRDYEKIINLGKVQPITFTECVGNYSGPDGRYNLTPNHKNPVSQLNWTGHAPQIEQARLANQHQCFTFQQVTELFRRLRTINPELSGVFPFTIMFYNWHTISRFMDMNPKPVTEQAKTSYQPVLLSWELWTPQVYAGRSIHPVVHIVNDSDDFSGLTDAVLSFQLLDKTHRALLSREINLPEIPYYGHHRIPLDIDIPENLSSGYYTLSGHIKVKDKIISRNFVKLFIANDQFINTGCDPFKNIKLYDPPGQTAQVLNLLHVNYEQISDFAGLNSPELLIIGEDAADRTLQDAGSTLKEFICGGGRILCLRQDTLRQNDIQSVLPVKIKTIAMNLDNPQYPPPPRPSANGYYINPERPAHPVFSGLIREQFEVWSDYTGWNETQPGLPAICPVTNGFVLENKDDIAQTAVLANYSVGLEGIALAEMFAGKGSLLLSGFDLVRRSGVDPIADRFLYNIISHMAGTVAHELHPFIDAPIVWGEYETERGVVTGIYSGLMLNTTPVLTGRYKDLPLVITQDGHQFAERFGGWNTRPGIQYVPNGRRPFGPYFHRDFGGIPTPEDKQTCTGSGHFWCRIPEYKKVVVTRVWNPSDELLDMQILLNGKIVSTESIRPDSTVVIKSRINKNTGTVCVQYKGDRRLVLVETAFE